jgi:hypothetical protein
MSTKEADINALRAHVALHHPLLTGAKGRAPQIHAAKGMAPLPPPELVTALGYFVLGDDAQLAALARDALETFPEGLLAAALQAAVPEAVLGCLCAELAEREAVMGLLLSNTRTPDWAIVAIAPHVSEMLAEIIAGNQERLLRSRLVVEALRQNKALPKSSRDRVFDFLVRAGRVYDDIPESMEAFARLSSTEVEKLAELVALPTVPELQQLMEERADDEVEETKRRSMTQVIARLNAAQKVVLALQGNRSARAILARDSNRMVCRMVAKNPRLTDSEVAALAGNRSVSEDLLREICLSAEFLKSYQVKKLLVYNPKTPPHVATRLLSVLQHKDIEAVSRSKDVTQHIVTQARRLVLRRK